MNIGSRRVRLLVPAGLILALTGVLVSTLLTGVSTGVYAASAAPERSRDYEIQGREYEQDGIIYDVPLVNDASRDAAVVYFPNNAVIPSYIDVQGVRYTVRTIREGAARTEIDDPDGWVTLPPTLKRVVLSKTVMYANWWEDNPSLRHAYGVQNVAINNLDSFLNMEYFEQTYSLAGGEDFHDREPLKGKWKLHLDGVELKNFDYVYPEGSSLGTNLTGLEGVKSITIPASDTLRTKELHWYFKPPTIWGQLPGRLQFKANEGYDLRFYNIKADTLVIPSGSTEFHGYGNLCYNIESVNTVQWPDNLKIFDSTCGLHNPISLEDLPKSLVRIGDLESATLELMASDTVTVPDNIEQLENLCFEGADKKIKLFNIKNCDKSLTLNGKVLITPIASFPTFRFDRNVVQKNQACNVVAVINDPTVNNRSATVIFGPDITELPKYGPLRLRDSSDHPVYPWRLVCEGLTPPEFETTNPYILKWKDATELIVPEDAIEAYLNHPIWKQFRTIQTTETDRITIDRKVVNEQWISLDGRSLNAPETGRINIQVTTYSDGTTISRKVSVPIE